MTKQKKQSGNLRGAQTKPKVSTTKPKSQNRQADAARLSAPVATAVVRRSVKANIQTSKRGVTVTHRAFMGPIYGSLAFSVSTYQVNPGILSTFPWLSRLASRYEKYRFKNLRFVYRSVVSTSRSGMIMMSFDYDVIDSPPAMKSIQAQTVPCVESNVWTQLDLPVPVDQTLRYIRQGNISSTVDLKTYDIGNLFCSVEYCDSTETMGELYVEYTVELQDPTEPIPLSAQLYGTNSVATPLVGGTINSKASPVELQADGTILFITSGEFSLTCMASGSTVNDLAIPTVVSGTAVIATLNGKLTTASYANRTDRIRASRGAIITYASKFAAATLIKFTVLVTEIDYTAVQNYI